MWLDHKRTALYRLYSETGTLLYIGISYDPEARFEQHAASKDWWPCVARRELRWFDDRPTAEAAEAEAIRAEDPEYNGTYSPRRDRKTARDGLAADGVREVSLSLARGRFTSIVTGVEEGGPAVALLNHGRRDAYIVSMDWYKQALEVRAAADTLREVMPELFNRLADDS